MRTWILMLVCVLTLSARSVCFAEDSDVYKRQVVAIGWERAEKDMESRHAPDPITWVDSCLLYTSRCV